MASITNMIFEYKYGPIQHREPIPGTDRSVRGLLSNREIFENRDIDIPIPHGGTNRKHPRNVVIDKAIEDAINSTETR